MQLTQHELNSIGNNMPRAAGEVRRHDSRHHSDEPQTVPAVTLVVHLQGGGVNEPPPAKSREF